LLAGFVRVDAVTMQDDADDLFERALLRIQELVELGDPGKIDDAALDELATMFRVVDEELRAAAREGRRAAPKTSEVAPARRSAKGAEEPSPDEDRERQRRALTETHEPVPLPGERVCRLERSLYDRDSERLHEQLDEARKLVDRVGKIDPKNPADRARELGKLAGLVCAIARRDAAP
jgi:hypothetical protein